MTKKRYIEGIVIKYMIPIGKHLISCGCIIPAIKKHPTMKNKDKLEGDLQPIVEICTSNPT